jgi:hypothetical protein
VGPGYADVLRHHTVAGGPAEPPLALFDTACFRWSQRPA